MKKYLLVIILVIAGLTRLFFLSDFPKGFSGDEAQQAYSAYSILKTGRDEWGQFLPLNPRGFGDFKPPLQTFLMVPSIAIFGLNEQAARLPAAIAGILTVAVVYFLTQKLFANKRLSLLAAFLLAINPWHIQISRTAFEGGFGVLLFSAGLLFFLKGLERQKYFIWSVLFWGMTFYTYHSFRLFLGLFLIFLVIYLRTRIAFQKNIAALVLFIMFLLPLIFNINSILLRSSDVGIFSQQKTEDYFKNKGTSPLPPILDKTFDNKFSYLGSVSVENYLSYYSPQFLFTGQRSDSSYLNFPGFSLLYQAEIITFLTGLFLVVKRKEVLMIGWLLLAAIPAALATGLMSANRAITLLPLVVIISALGLEQILGFKKIKFLENLKIKVVAAILMLSFLSFAYFYTVKLPKNNPESLRADYKSVFRYTLQNQSNYNQLVFSKVFSQPQIFLAFYGKIDPTFFQQNSQDWLRYEKSNKLYIDQLESWNLGKFYFEDLNWQMKDSKRVNALVISKPEDFPQSVKSVYEIKKGDLLIYKFVSTNAK